MLTIAPFPPYTGGEEGQRHRAETAALCCLERLRILSPAAWEQRKDHWVAPKNQWKGQRTCQWCEEHQHKPACPNMLTPICTTTTIAEVPSSLLSPIFPLVTVKNIRAGFTALVMWAPPSPEKTTVKPSSPLQESAKQPGNGKAIPAGLDVGPNGKNLHHQNCKLLCFVVHCWFTFCNTAEQTLPRCLHTSVSSAI